MSSNHGHSGNKHSPKSWEKTLANLFASVVMGIGTLLHSVFKSVFRLLESMT